MDWNSTEVHRGLLNPFHFLPLPKSVITLGRDRVTRVVKFISYPFIKKKSHISWCPPHGGHLASTGPDDFSSWFHGGKARPGTAAKLEIASALLGSSIHAGSVSQPVNSTDKVRAEPC